LVPELSAKAQIRPSTFPPDSISSLDNAERDVGGCHTSALRPERGRGRRVAAHKARRHPRALRPPRPVLFLLSHCRLHRLGSAASRAVVHGDGVARSGSAGWVAEMERVYEGVPGDGELTPPP